MHLVNKITNQPHQRIFLTGNTGQRIILDLRYMPTQMMWVASFTLGDLVIQGICLNVSPNMLRNYKNIAPFGMALFTTDGQDPRGVSDFFTGYAKLYLLTQDEVLEVESMFFE